MILFVKNISVYFRSKWVLTLIIHQKGKGYGVHTNIRRIYEYFLLLHLIQYLINMYYNIYIFSTVKTPVLKKHNSF